MRTYEMRAYTLRTLAALDFYCNTVYVRHLDNFDRFSADGCAGDGGAG